MSKIAIKLYYSPKKERINYIDFSDKDFSIRIESIYYPDGIAYLFKGKTFKIGEFLCNYDSNGYVPHFGYTNLLINYCDMVEMLNYLLKTREFFVEDADEILFEKFENMIQFNLQDFGCDEFEPNYQKQDEKQLSVFSKP